MSRDLVSEIWHMVKSKRDDGRPASYPRCATEAWLTPRLTIPGVGWLRHCGRSEQSGPAPTVPDLRSRSAQVGLQSLMLRGLARLTPWLRHQQDFASTLAGTSSKLGEGSGDRVKYVLLVRAGFIDSDDYGRPPIRVSSGPVECRTKGLGQGLQLSYQPAP